MRLSDKEKSIILEAIKKLDPDADVYLFGSRTDDLKKGGDIDILILSNRLKFHDKLKIKATAFKKIEEQKIDLVIAKDNSDPFVKLALDKGIKLQ